MAEVKTFPVEQLRELVDPTTGTTTEAWVLVGGMETEYAYQSDLRDWLQAQEDAGKQPQAGRYRVIDYSYGSPSFSEFDASVRRAWDIERAKTDEPEPGPVEEPAGA